MLPQLCLDVSPSVALVTMATYALEKSKFTITTVGFIRLKNKPLTKTNKV